MKKHSFSLHRIRFFEPEPKPIRSLSLDESISRLAVSRSDSSIEIWDVTETPYQEHVIPADNHSSIETICFCGGRLFSGGLTGYIIEHDIKGLLPKFQILVTSGCPIWCMAVNKEKSQLAVGNEDGYVILHDITLEGLDFSQRFDKQEGAILCLDWHKDGHIIATGSLDAIRTWNVRTGHVINRIMLSREIKNMPTVVWCIAITSDMTIVSGDSTGKLSFWDGKTGTLISCSGPKKGDILSLAVSKEEDIIYASGVEPTITAYMQSQSNGKWMKSVQRVVHTHDVRALQLMGDRLFSGGDDCNLLCTKYPPKVVLPFYPFCQKTYATVAAEASCILLRYPEMIELWTIGDDRNFKHLMRIKPKENEKVVSSSISPNGNWIAYSTQFEMRLFSIPLDPEFENLNSFSKVELPNNIPPSKILIFFNDSTRLLCYDGNKIFIIKCDSVFTSVEATLNENPDFTGQIHIMSLSDDDSYLACGCHNGNVIVYCLKSLEICRILPLYTCQPTALSFVPSTENLVVAYCDRKVVEYNIKKQAYTSWSKQQMLHHFKDASSYPIISMCFCASTLFLMEENAIYIFNREDQVTPGRKRIKQSDKTETTVTESNYKTVEIYDHLSSMHSFKDQLLVVQISSSHISKALPPPIWKKVYGT